MCLQENLCLRVQQGIPELERAGIAYRNIAYRSLFACRLFTWLVNCKIGERAVSRASETRRSHRWERLCRGSLLRLRLDPLVIRRSIVPDTYEHKFRVRSCPQLGRIFSALRT